MVLPMPGSSKCLLLQPLPELNFIISTLHFSNWQTVCYWVIFTHCRAGHPGLHGDLLRDHLHPAHAPAVGRAGEPLLTDFWIDKTKVDAVVPTLMDAFNLPDDIRSFMFDQYLPEVGSNWPKKYYFLNSIDSIGHCWHQPRGVGEGPVSVEHRGHACQAHLCFPLAGGLW